MNILVIDDDLAHGQALGDFLAAHGYQAHVFASAGEVIAKKVELRRYDLILSDINMPGVSGLDLCRSVRQQNSLGRIPIILITGYNSISEKAAGLEAGADDFISKPCHPGELLAKIRSLLQIRAREIATLQELTSTRDQNERLQNLRRFLSPNVANILAADPIETVLRPHRRDVTVLFSDLRGFTAFSENHEPEVVLDVLSRYYSAVGEAAMRHKGTLGHLAGDGIMVFFNDPHPIADHMETAVRMAREARAELIDQRRFWRERNYALDFGMGLSSGHATIGAFGFDRFSQYSVIGPVPNFASRLCAAAQDGQILISERFRGRLRHETFPTESLGTVQIKGYEAPVKIHKVA